MDNSSDQTAFRCGYVGIVGRPNVGKSTLINHVLGQKLCITSRKPQTTRYTLLGVKTDEASQMIFVDTPGIHKEQHTALNRYMNKSAMSVIPDVDVLVFMIEKNQWKDEDEWVLKQLQFATCPVILAINKVDQLEDKQKLLPFIESVQSKFNFSDIIPLSALRDLNVGSLEGTLIEHLPMNPPFFAEDQITDRSERFFAAEIVREKLMRMLGQELPYQLAVEVERFEQQESIAHIHILIWVERENQKSIIIGKRGSKLKTIASEARVDMESFLDQKVMLNLWVKVKSGWSNDLRALQSLGYHDN
ncbi:MAG: GTPase Era [Pseudomonadota bacterium]